MVVTSSWRRYYGGDVITAVVLQHQRHRSGRVAAMGVSGRSCGAGGIVVVVKLRW